MPGAPLSQYRRVDRQFRRLKPKKTMHIYYDQDSSESNKSDLPAKEFDDSLRMAKFVLGTLHLSLSLVKGLDDPEPLCGAHILSSKAGTSKEVKMAIKADSKDYLSTRMLGAVLGVLLEELDDKGQRLSHRINGTPKPPHYEEEQEVGASILKILGVRVSGSAEEYLSRISEAAQGAYEQQTETLLTKARTLSPVRVQRTAKPKDDNIVAQAIADFRKGTRKLKSVQSLTPIANKFELLINKLESQAGSNKAKPNVNTQNAA